MSLYRRNPRRDSNEASIIEALQKQGFHVVRLSGAGLPDLLVSRGSDFMRLVEIKQPKGTYTPEQLAFRSLWQGPPIVLLRSVGDALRFMVLACERPQSVGASNFWQTGV